MCLVHIIKKIQDGDDDDDEKLVVQRDSGRVTSLVGKALYLLFMLKPHTLDRGDTL